MLYMLQDGIRDNNVNTFIGNFVHLPCVADMNSEIFYPGGRQVFSRHLCARRIEFNTVNECGTEVLTCMADIAAVAAANFQNGFTLDRETGKSLIKLACFLKPRDLLGAKIFLRVNPEQSAKQSG